MNLPDLSGISRDVISNLGQYMNQYELRNRRGTDPLWDRLIVPLEQSDVNSDIRRAIQERDNVTLNEIIGTLDPSNESMNMFFRNWIRVANQPNPALYPILRAWGNHEGSRLTSDITEAIMTSAAPDSAVYKLLRLSPKFSDVTRLIRDYGEKAVFRTLNWARAIGLADDNYIAQLLAIAVTETNSATYLRDIEFFNDLLRRHLDIPGLDQAIDRLAESYRGNRSNLYDNIRNVVNLIGQYANISVTLG